MALKILFNNKNLDTTVREVIKKENYFDLSRQGIDEITTKIFRNKFENTWKGNFNDSIRRAIKSSVKKHVRAKKASATGDYILFKRENSLFKNQSLNIENIQHIKKIINEIKKREYEISVSGGKALLKDLGQLIDFIGNNGLNNLAEKLTKDIESITTILENKGLSDLNNEGFRSYYHNPNNTYKPAINDAKAALKKFEKSTLNDFVKNYLSHNFSYILTANEMDYIDDNDDKILNILRNNEVIRDNAVNKKDLHKVGKKVIKETDIGTVEDKLYLEKHRSAYVHLRSLNTYNLNEEEQCYQNNANKSAYREYFEENGTFDRLDKIFVADLEKRFLEKITPFLRGITENKKSGKVIYNGYFIYSTLKSISKYIIDKKKLNTNNITDLINKETQIKDILGKCLSESELQLLLKCFIGRYDEMTEKHIPIIDDELIDEIHLYLKIRGKSSNPLINLIGEMFVNRNDRDEKEFKDLSGQPFPLFNGFGGIQINTGRLSEETVEVVEDEYQDQSAVKRLNTNTDEITRRENIKKAKPPKSKRKLLLEPNEKATADLDKVAKIENKFSKKDGARDFLRKVMEIGEFKGIFYSNVTFNGYFIYSTLKSLFNSEIFKTQYNKKHITLKYIKKLLTKNDNFISHGSEFEYIIRKQLNPKEKEILMEFIRIFKEDNLIGDIHNYMEIKEKKSSNPLINLIHKNFYNDNDKANWIDNPLLPTHVKNKSILRKKLSDDDSLGSGTVDLINEKTPGDINQQKSIPQTLQKQLNNHVSDNDSTEYKFFDIYDCAVSNSSDEETRIAEREKKLSDDEFPGLGTVDSDQREKPKSSSRIGTENISAEGDKKLQKPSNLSYLNWRVFGRRYI